MSWLSFVGRFSGVSHVPVLGVPRGEATSGGEFLHMSIPAMAAAYLFHRCQIHPFKDGNRRVAANAAVTFLLMNDWGPTFQEDEPVEVVLAVASGMLTKQQLIEVFESRCRPSENA